MGGSLFSSKRLPTAEYVVLEKTVLDILKNRFPERRFDVPDGFKDKTDYGDLDIITSFPLITDNELKEMFGVTDDQIHHNSSVISFSYQSFQIDLCHFEPEYLDTALDYMRQSDTSNIIGQMARYSTGYRLTHKGLMYPVRLKPEDNLGEIRVSTNRKSIHEFLDLDHEQWLKGFDNALQMFEWISRSRYFNPDCFKFEALSHQDRTRNVKRKTYSAFVEWLDGQLFKYSYEVTKNKQEHLFRGLLHFRNESGWWIDQAQKMIQDRQWQEQARATFNANDIMEITGLSGPALGMVRKAFDSYLIKRFDLNDKKSGPRSISWFIGARTEEYRDDNRETMIMLFHQFYAQYLIDNL